MDAVATEVAFQADNYFRPLDWQLRLAERIAACRLPLPRHPDHAALRTAVEFLLAESRCRTSRAREGLIRRYPALSEGLRLAQINTPLTWEVRARILAGQPDEEIARRCGITAESVHWFEALHFNVRDRLEASDWITARVIGAGPWRGFTDAERGRSGWRSATTAGPWFSTRSSRPPKSAVRHLAQRPAAGVGHPQMETCCDRRLCWPWGR